MWLPTSIYEALPAIYGILGLVFLAGSLYVYTYYALAPMYFVIGVMSVLAGLLVAQRRLQARRVRPQSESSQAQSTN